MKKIKYILSLTVITVFLFGCDSVETASQDAEPFNTDFSRYPTATISLTSGGATTFNEKGEPMFVYDIVLDQIIDRAINFTFEQVGGNATLHDDYDFTGGTVAAGELTTQISLEIHNDVEVEGTETLDLEVISGPQVGNKYLVNPKTVFPSLSLTIEDYVFCGWTLLTSDTYGDGWNGGYVELVTEGVTTQYAEDDDEPTLFDIGITEGEDYTFTYVSGGGTGAGPGWESENYFKLTAPDGTVFEEGTMDYSGIPTAGVITSGTSSCN